MFCASFVLALLSVMVIAAACEANEEDGGRHAKVKLHLFFVVQGGIYLMPDKTFVDKFGVYIFHQIPPDGFQRTRHSFRAF